MKDPIASARRAVATAERRCQSQREVVEKFHAQVVRAVPVARALGLDRRWAISQKATLDAARTELDIRERVLALAHKNLARVLSEHPTPRRAEIEPKSDTPPTPQNKKEEPMSNPRQKINDAIDTALYANATESELESALAMSPEQARRFLQLRAARRAKEK